MVVVLILGGFYFLSSNKSVTQPETAVSQVYKEGKIETLTPKDIGLSLTATPDLRKVIITVSETEDLSALDYQLSYVAKGDIPRGILGHIDVVFGRLVQQEIVLGTCSDVCHYDQDVSDVKLILKVTKTNNKIYQVEQTLGL